MAEHPFLRTIQLRNILSYGPDTPELKLEPLNILIGPNASGKSNLIEALSILAAAPREIQKPIREGGGVSDWPWKGEFELPVALIDVTTYNPSGIANLRYRVQFRELAGRFHLEDEVVEYATPFGDHTQPFFLYKYDHGSPVISARVNEDPKSERSRRTLRKEDVDRERSILAQRRDPDSFPELTYLANRFERMCFYREWNFGRYTAPRRPQKADLQQDFLLEDAGNLGLVLNDLQNRPMIKQRLLEELRHFYSGVNDVTTRVIGGTIQVYFHEEGLSHPIPATRLSDGTLHFLCLLSILCHPEPPPVVCIEEPEIGLHPDAAPIIGRLLMEASERTQLFVTTHSTALIDSVSESPQSVVVCERGPEGTELKRLDADNLKEWLDKYRLGEIWQMGEIGGNPR